MGRFPRICARREAGRIQDRLRAGRIRANDEPRRKAAQNGAGASHSVSGRTTQHQHTPPTTTAQWPQMGTQPRDRTERLLGRFSGCVPPSRPSSREQRFFKQVGHGDENPAPKRGTPGLRHLITIVTKICADVVIFCTISSVNGESRPMQILQR